MFDPFNGRLFQQFGNLCASLVTINQMQLEKIPISQRNKLLKRHGNCRSGMAKLLFESWARLGEFILPLDGVRILQNHLHEKSLFIVGRRIRTSYM